MLDLLANRSALLLRSGAVATPFLMMDCCTITEQVRRWKRYLPEVALHFAVKANNDPLVIRLLADLGCSFDTASAFEMKLVATLGVPPDRMVLSHPAKDIPTLTALPRFKPWAVVADKEKEIERLRMAGVPRSDYSPVLLVRLRTASQNIQANLSEKFGCRPERAVDVLRYARSAGFQNLGLSFHVGTQCYDATNYRRAIEPSRAVAEQSARAGLPIEWIDIGGGFCDARTANERGTSLDDLFAGVAESVGSLKGEYRLLGEPGRYLVADAGTIVVQVLSEYVSDQTHRRIGIDEHVYGGLSGQWHDGRIFDFHPLRLNEGEPLSTIRTPCTIFGATCDSIDRIQGRRGEPLLPNNLDIGDYLLVPCAGAYSTSAGSNFNGMEPAAVVMTRVDCGQLQWEVSPLARKGELILDAIRGA